MDANTQFPVDRQKPLKRSSPWTLLDSPAHFATKLLFAGRGRSGVAPKRSLMRILIAEDDEVLADGLVRLLRNGGHAVDRVARGTEADFALVTQSFDLLILDLGLPLLSGSDVLRRLRARGSTIPVLILSASNNIDRCVKELDKGADDFMSKPFALAELEARIRALLRRGLRGAPSLIRSGPVSIDRPGRVAYLNDQLLELSARELGILEFLFSRPGRIVSKRQLVEYLCNCDQEISLNAVEVYVHRLRKKLEAGGVRISTARGLGYCLERQQDEG